MNKITSKIDNYFKENPGTGYAISELLKGFCIWTVGYIVGTVSGVIDYVKDHQKDSEK